MVRLGWNCREMRGAVVELKLERYKDTAGYQWSMENDDVKKNLLLGTQKKSHPFIYPLAFCNNLLLKPQRLCTRSFCPDTGISWGFTQFSSKVTLIIHSTPFNFKSCQRFRFLANTPTQHSTSAETMADIEAPSGPPQFSFFGELSIMNKQIWALPVS